MSRIVRERSFYVQAAKIGIPIALQYLITVGVSMLDTVMLGRLDETALSASSLANQVFTLFQTMCMGMGMGAGVMTARFWGKGDLCALKKTVAILYRLALILILGFTLVCGIAPAGVMRIFTPEQALIDQGTTYFRWALPCFALHALSLTTSLVLRSIGRVHIPLLSSIGAFFVNLFFNWVFIFGNLGAPRMEIAGAALGTVISRVFEMAVNCGFFFFVERQVRFRLCDLFLKCGDLLGIYLSVSIPVLISDTLLGLGNSMVAVVVGHIGGGFVSANSITMVTQQLCSVLAQGIANAAAVMTGHTLGRGQRERAQIQGNTFLLLGVGVGLLSSGVILLAAPYVVGSYALSAGTHAIAMELMGAIAFINTFQCANSILTKGVLRGGGDTKFLMGADVIFLWVVSVPLGACAGLVWRLSPFLIYLCLKLDQVLKAVMCVFRLTSRKWIKVFEHPGDRPAVQ